MNPIPNADLGHSYNAQGRSSFRVFAPEASSLVVQRVAGGPELPLQRNALGYWTGDCERLPHGSLYWLLLDGRRLADPASRYQPQGVHGPSMVCDVQAVHSPGWAGIPMADAILYELHLGTFTPEGTLAAAVHKLPHLAGLGINVVELLPIAACPGQRNWGYDGTFLFALYKPYGSYADLKAFIKAAHAQGIAVVLDVVYNHFGPEGNYTGAFAPYTKQAATPWGAAINFDTDFNHGVREFFLQNLRFWLQTVGFDGVRMDAVSLIFDNMPVHILREFTDLARAIGQDQGREVLTIAEHLRNNRFVTADPGFNYHAQWNDDLNHAVFAKLTGETSRHYINFGGFGDVVKALQTGFVLDGSRFDNFYRYLLGTDGALTQASAHVVHIQNHDQIGNRLLGDRMIATYGRDKALLGITTVMASPFVPMLFMGEEYGETAPCLLFEDFYEQVIIDGAREGRKADFSFGGVEPPDPHALATFEASRLQWQRTETADGRAMLDYYRQLITLKRTGRLGPRNLAQVQVQGDPATQLIRVQTAHTLTLLNFSDQAQAFDAGPGWVPLLSSIPQAAPGVLAPFGALILAPAGQP